MSSSSAFDFSFLFFFSFLFMASGQTITRSMTFTEKKETIVSSPGAIFELGLFKTNKEGIRPDSRWYLGIWYKRFPDTIVWIANRDEPLYNSFGTLSISNSSLLFRNRIGSTLWSTSPIVKKRGPLMAELMGNGNFVLRDQNGILWQSFDHPADILIPGMKLGSYNNILQSWKSFEDPSNGIISYETSSHLEGVRETILESYISTGPQLWRIDPILANVFLTSRKNQDDTYNLRGETNTTYYVFLRLHYTGLLSWSKWTAPSQEWTTLLTFPRDICSSYDICGPNSICHIQRCTCIEGYEQIHRGCVRIKSVSCVKARLQLMNNMKLPEFNDDCIVDNTIGFEDCKRKCLENCNCTAVANTIVVSTGELSCVMWTRELIDVRNYTDMGQDLYVKLDSAPPANHKEESENKKNGLIIGLTVAAAVVVILILYFVTFLIWKRKTRNRGTRTTTTTEVTRPDIELDEEEWRTKLIQFDVISVATNNFSEANVIGKGGFGIVYKGWLDGEVIAVKRLFKMSAHGIQGFENEIKIIALLQHINLVRLIGFFISESEKLLVYEFLHNSSLDTYIFDTNRRRILNWKMRFDIVNGIARGLSYLHQDSRLRIIHLDLKPSNILLDKDMIPKISDFGMAKILSRDDEQAETKSAAGTFGYMSPEYAMYNIYSDKSDVFSFGVMLLEIISGKKNNAFSRLNRGENLLSYAWKLWNEGKGLEIVDSVIKDSASSSSSLTTTTFSEEEVLRCLHISLLCVQEIPEDRPMMSSVVLMLGTGHMDQFLIPKQPVQTGSSSTQQQEPDSESVSSQLTQNEITMSFVHPQ